MKLGYIVTACLLAVCLVALVVFFLPTSPTEPVSEQPVTKATPHPKVMFPSQGETFAPPAPLAMSTMPPTSDPAHDEKVHDRVQELLTLAMNDDQASLKTIWAELANPDKDVRAGALEAVVQFGDRSKEKALRTMAEDIEDAEEKRGSLPRPISLRCRRFPIPVFRPRISRAPAISRKTIKPFPPVRFSRQGSCEDYYTVIIA